MLKKIYSLIKFEILVAVMALTALVIKEELFDDIIAVKDSALSVKAEISDIEEEYEAAVNETDRGNISFWNDEGDSADYIKDAGTGTIYLLNDKYFDKIFGKQQPTKQELYELVDNNLFIPDDIKAEVKAFIAAMTEYYGNLELRPFAENLSRVVIMRYPDTLLKKENERRCAYFDCGKCIIVLKDDFDIKLMQDKIVLRHELGHMFNNVLVHNDFGQKIIYIYSLDDSDRKIKEGFDVVFTAAPYLDNEYADFSYNYAFGYVNEADAVKRQLEETGYDITRYTRYTAADYREKVLGGKAFEI